VVTLIEIREIETPQLPENTRIVGKAYEFKPSGTVFDKSIKLTLGYTRTNCPTASPPSAWPITPPEYGGHISPPETRMSPGVGKVTAR
jgi:hypothetical protein